MCHTRDIVKAEKILMIRMRMRMMSMMTDCEDHDVDMM